MWLDPRAATGRPGLRPVKRRLDEDLLTPTEIAAVVRACSTRSASGVRNAAMIAIAWRSGPRLGEVLALQTKDIDHAGGTLVVQHGKGDKRRVVGFDGGAIALVERWLKMRQRIGLRHYDLVFTTLAGQPIDQSYVRHLLPRLARRAGIAKRVHAHGLRHAYAVELEREGASVTQIRDLLGHSSLAVTDQYLRRLGASDAVEFSRRREWSLV